MKASSFPSGPCLDSARLRVPPRTPMRSLLCAGLWLSLLILGFAPNAQAQYQMEGAAFNDMTPVVPRGLSVQFFNNTSLGGSPVLERRDGPIDFNWGGSPGAGVDADNFSGRWQGFIRIPNSGAYRFYVTSDDGVRLWIQDLTNATVNSWVNRASTEDSTGTYNFTAGDQIPVKIEFYEALGGASLRLAWEGPSIPKGIIPPSALIPLTGASDPDGLPVTFPAIEGQPQGPNLQSVGSTSSTSAATSTNATLSLRHPSQIYRDNAGQQTAAVILLESSLGYSFASGVPRYFMGDIIQPPLARSNGTPVPVSYWRTEPVRPGEVINHTSGGPETPLPANALVNYYYSPHARRVFATQPGLVTVRWVSRLPEAGRYQFNTETFGVSSSTRVNVKLMYWTERGFNAPTISIPPGRITIVNPVYNAFFPASVATEYLAPGTVRDPNAIDALPPEKRTFWVNSNGAVRTLRAYNFEGRIFVEYLGALNPDGSTYEFLGADIVQVEQAAPPAVVTVKLGEQILPQDSDAQLMPSALTQGAIDQSYGSTTRSDGRVIYYAERESLDPDKVQFYWLEAQDAGIYDTVAPGLSLQWVKYLNKYRLIWPDQPSEFAHLVIPSGGSTPSTGVYFGDGGVPQIVWQDDGSLTEATVDLDTRQLIVKPLGGNNRSLLKFVSGTEFWYVRVDSNTEPTVTDGNRDGTSFSANATVGQRIERPSPDYEPGGYISSGTAFSQQAYLNPYSITVDGAAAGSIIPVNAVPGNDRLTVWWFKKVNPPNNKFSPFFLASRVGNYSVSYPATPEKIILASNDGSSELGPSELAGSLYIQNDRNLPGFNPNEEHAVIVAGRVYALRDDLNITTGPDYTSQPYAMLSYQDSSDNRPAMKIWKIEREDATYKFDYPVTAGTILQGPMPIPILPLALDANGKVKNTEVTPPGIDPRPDATSPVRYDSFTFEDRKGYHWVYRGPHSGTGNQRLEFKFYYAMQPDFFFPGLTNPPAVGTALPYLRPLDGNQQPVGNPVSGESIIIKYQPVWPVCPELRVAETLTLPKFGLPAVRGQTSAEILYQQSVARSGTTKPATTLHDPTRQKIIALDAPAVGLTKLPASAATTGSFGKIYFQFVPPHLQKRFYYDPLLGPKGSLVLKGEFINEIAGEDYLNLNVLSPAEVNRLKSVVLMGDADRGRWNAAIDALTTSVETFIQNPARAGTYIVGSSVNVGETELATISDSDTAVDSYALTATGQGDGYVTLLFSDGKAFTPGGEPVAMKVIKVTPQLYTGDLKVLQSENPLDEQITLRHSGDFAARPGDYEFQWYRLPPDGNTPATYRYQMAMAFGSPSQTQPAGRFNNWASTRNPVAPVAPGTAIPAGNTFSLPRNLVIQDATFNAASGLPGLVLTNTTPVDFTTGVPQQLTFSASPSLLTGFVLYVNGTAALASNAPAGFENIAGTSGLSISGLQQQWSVDPNFFTKGLNKIDIALYTTADRLSSEVLDFRLEYSQETDLVTTGGRWLPVPSAVSNIEIVGGDAASPLGSPLLAMSDNYFTMRYRAKPGTNNVAGTEWSRWMPAKLVEGWIKRVLAGINPFNQRIRDLLNNPVNTDVSLLTQAGTRWEGDVALNLQNINDYGLIEIYETVLKRGKNLSIDSGYDYGPANDALLLAAGYLNDLYNILGNEAFADAANPTISVDDQSTITEVNTSRFSFEGQVTSVLEEELGLLRGRDDFLNPGVTVAPAYNRFYWNYTRGINSGEALYAVNYNIKEKAGSSAANGVLDAADAQRMFPQGHGDAYGHYLTALKGYTYLLTNPNFTWVPRSEAVTVLGQAVQIDYSDERKFARAAANLARTAEQIQGLTHRQAYKDDDSAGWKHFRDGKYNPNTGIIREAGLDEWTARSTQGVLFNWIVGNAILPEKDTNPNHTGVQIIDRTTVPELDELAASAMRFQNTIDNANARLNPLGLSPDSIAFDISPTQLQQGRSHFDQVYERALKAVLNAKGSFDQAAKMTRLLRNQENQIGDYNAAIVGEERAYVSRLIDIFGSPYTGDIGAGKTYTQDYTGPDLVNWFVVDRPTNIVETTHPVAITVPVAVNVGSFTGNSIGDVQKTLEDSKQVAPRTLTIQPNRFIQYSDLYQSGGMGQRSVTGRLQQALLDAHEAQLNVLSVGTTMDNLNMRFRREYQLFGEMVKAHITTITRTKETNKLVEDIERTEANLEVAALFLSELGELADDMADAAMESGIKFFGLSVDGASPAAGAIKLVGSFVAFALNMSASGMEGRAILQRPKVTQALNKLEVDLTEIGMSVEQKQAIYEFELLFDEMMSVYEDLAKKSVKLQRANEQVRNVLAEGEMVLADREVFRKRAAAIVQGYRTRDLTFRTFRNEALEQYRTLYDLAGRYTYLATKSYDYETGLLGTSSGNAVISSIVASRSLGDLTGGVPQATTSTLGDSGLAGVMARLQSDWSVAKGRLGINNPDTYGTLFNLRGENFRILNSPTTLRDDAQWQQTLERHIVRDVMADADVARYCANIRKLDGSAVPGIILPFSTTIQHGKNFFGLPLAGGDHAYSASSFATKIYSVGMSFPGYVGMDPTLEGNPNGAAPNANSPLALSATPYVYLIPCGTDSMLAPSLGDTGTVRSWQVSDQALPLPFNLGATAFNSTQFFTAQDTLTEKPWIVRKHQAFRVVNDASLFYSRLPEEFTCRRLVGRSAWNSQWKLVIPAYTLLSNEQEGLSRFVASVKDIQLFLRTYSHSGN